MRTSNSDNSAYDILVKRRALAIYALHEGRFNAPASLYTTYPHAALVAGR
jgi:hypothetical protein